MHHTRFFRPVRLSYEKIMRDAIMAVYNRLKSEINALEPLECLPEKHVLKINVKHHLPLTMVDGKITAIEENSQFGSENCLVLL